MPLEWGTDCDSRIVLFMPIYGQYTGGGWHIDHIQASCSWWFLIIITNKRPRHWQGNTRAGGAPRQYVAEVGR